MLCDDPDSQISSPGEKVKCAIVPRAIREATDAHTDDILEARMTVTALEDVLRVTDETIATGDRNKRSNLNCK